MNAPARLSPAKVANYAAEMELKLGRKVARASILPDGRIEVTMVGIEATVNPADLVDMSE